MREPETKNSVRVELGLGGNIGDSAREMAGAVAALQARGVGRLLKASSLWRTPPWGNLDQAPFANACVTIETGLAPYPLLAALKTLEADLGRQPTTRWGPRLIDLDILFYGEVALQDPELTLPHREILARAFVLAPLAEIAPDRTICGLPIGAALARVDLTGLEIKVRGDIWLESAQTGKI